MDGKCALCGETDQSILDCHRIIPGSEGGKYTLRNTVTTCSNCHRKIHDGQVKILGRHPTSRGCDCIHVETQGIEDWIFLN